jgi:hypothetical protein
MKSLASCISLVLATAALLAVGAWLGTTVPDSCGGVIIPRPVTAASGPVPTPAPPQKAVLVRVEVDESDLQVGWADNR